MAYRVLARAARINPTKTNQPVGKNKVSKKPKTRCRRCRWTKPRCTALSRLSRGVEAAGYSASFRRTQDKLYPRCNLRPCRTCPRNGNSLSKAKLLHRNGKVMPDGLLGIFTMERAFWKAPKGPTPVRPRLEGRNELEPRRALNPRWVE